MKYVFQGYVIPYKTLAQQLKNWHLNVTRVLLVQQQIIINNIHVWQVEIYL